MVIECCVPYCRVKASAGFHNFPRNSERRRQWLKAIKVFYCENDELDSFRKVCKRHFLPSDFFVHANGLLRLKFDSVPSQHLPCFTWLEHSYVNRRIKDKPNMFKPAKQSKTLKSTKKKLPSKGMVVDFDEGTVCISLKNKQSVSHGNPPLSFSGETSSASLMGGTSNTSTNRTSSSTSLIGGVSSVNFNEEEASVSSSDQQTIRTLKVTILELKKELMMKDKMITSLNKTLRFKTRQIQQLRQKLKFTKPTKGNVMKCIEDTFAGNKQVVMFFEMQLKIVGKPKNANRFTSEQKIFCLALYKQSPKTYRNMLKRFFTLPSKRTLGRHSARLVFESGINSTFFEFLKVTSASLTEIDRNCVLVWDEMALKPHIDYNESTDMIDGFVEIIAARKPIFATHALVFMVRGISKKYKEPVAYFYTDGLKFFELAEMIKLVGVSVLNAGLNILGSVCDQAASNVTAVHSLINSNANTFGRAKSGRTRNNLQTKNLRHSILRRWSSSSSVYDLKRKKEQIASWDDVTEVFNSLKGKRKLLSKITEEHIKPVKLKMKVVTACQIFSESYAKTMLQCSKNEQLSNNCSGTAQALIFFNDLFDSLNGSCSSTNELKSAVSKGSVHFRFWEHSLEILSKMNFIDKDKGIASKRTKNIENWMSTIRGYRELSEKCLRLGMTDIALRY
ncbi:Transposable element P transposase [Pseudolycoriella hygida]|uniref:Transposable element P transposase n=1 Tax=Pseudolycoriella hygida TaxID=35572 RepID=A0A9Q0MWA5_9DIPT|nr:Transposable element P transposase [Pseudolycoriella hygida]